jgi:hypothetical protein
MVIVLLSECATGVAQRRIVVARSFIEIENVLRDVMLFFYHHKSLFKYLTVP